MKRRHSAALAAASGEVMVHPTKLMTCSHRPASYALLSGCSGMGQYISMHSACLDSEFEQAFAHLASLTY